MWILFLMKAITWNVRGMRMGEKKKALRRLIKSENPHIILLQETKLKKCTQNLYIFIWLRDRIKGVSVQSEINPGV